MIALLTQLAGALARVEGFDGAELWQEAGDRDEYRFDERWQSLEARLVSADHVPPGFGKALMATLAAAPKASDLLPVLLLPEAASAAL